MKERYTDLNEISELIGISYNGNNEIVNGLNLCNRESQYPGVISYITSEAYVEFVENNKSIRALFLTQYLYEYIQTRISRSISFFIVENPEIYFYKLHEQLVLTSFYNKYSFSPQIGKECNIHSSAVIEDGAVIGNHVTIGPLSVIRKGSIIDDYVKIGCCSVIGSEGFQAISFEDNIPKMITHVGGTYLAKYVMIGDNSTVGNALFEGETVLGENCKVDNHVHIAHNCTIGLNNVITASCLLMGSSVLKNNVWLAPNVVIMNKKIINNNGFVGSMSLVTKDVSENTTVFGIPAKERHC